MTLEDFNSAIDSGKVVDIWRIADIMLDVRNSLDNEYDQRRVDDLMRTLGVQEDGPSIILTEKVQELVDTLQEEELL